MAVGSKPRLLVDNVTHRSVHPRLLRDAARANRHAAQVLNRSSRIV